ncbi:5092_t:CDS:2, partial [Acaulospora colombiana]
RDTVVAPVPRPAAVAASRVSKPSTNGHPPTLFGLLIGIDKYQNAKYRLEGAVEDAKAVERYLKTTFPSSRLRALHNQDATRSAMIREIDYLIKNKDIKRQDPIVIFYAGHGGETVPPAGWDTQGKKIQMFMPQDYNDDAAVITDLGFATLLEELASAHGDNILVILDCCHSGSMTRGVDNTGNAESTSRRTRSIRVTHELPDDVDRDIFRRKGARSIAVPTTFQYNGVASHVLLAACAANELAIEEGGRGAFTRALLKTINDIGYQNLTYEEFIRHLPTLHKQTPRCEGDNRGRYFFDTQAPARDNSFFEVQMEGNDLVVKAGTVHGIDNMTEFALYQRRDKNSAPIGYFTVRNVKVSSSTLKVNHSSQSIALPAYAMAVKSVRVSYTGKSGLKQVHAALQGEMATNDPRLQQYAVVPRDQSALEIDMSGDRVVFNTVNPRLHALGYSRMPFRVKADEPKIIRSIIQAGSEFDKFLHLEPATRRIKDYIKVEFVKIMRPADRHYGPAVRDANGVNLCNGDLVQIPAGDTLYGIKIINNSSQQLYPHLFLFDCSDFSIDKDAPLQPNGGVLTIGYGTGGENPWSHYVRDEEVFQSGKVTQDQQNLDVGVFKLFLTTKPADLSSMEQQSPFSGDYRAARKLQWDDLVLWARPFMTSYIPSSISRLPVYIVRPPPLNSILMDPNVWMAEERNVQSQVQRRTDGRFS